MIAEATGTIRNTDRISISPKLDQPTQIVQPGHLADQGQGRGVAERASLISHRNAGIDRDQQREGQRHAEDQDPAEAPVADLGERLEEAGKIMARSMW